MNVRTLNLTLGAVVVVLLGVGVGRWTTPRIVSADAAPGIQSHAPGIQSHVHGIAIDLPPTREVTASDFRVLRIIDGDTFKVRYDGDITSVRILDINAPERGDPRAEAATEELRRRIAGRTVHLDFAAARRRDNFGRLLCRVIIDGIDVGEHLLDRGLVEPYLPGPRRSQAE